MTGSAPHGSWLPHGIDAQVLADVARVALDNRHVTLTGWRCESLWEPRLASTRGVYKISLALAVDGSPTALELVLKALSRSDDGAILREAELYRSGVLASLPAGVVAASCFGVSDLPDGSVGVWLEKIEDAVGTWAIAQFGVAAYHVGQLAALSRGLAAVSARSVRPRNLCALPQVCAENLQRLQQLRDHPLVRRAYPGSVVADLLALWSDHASVLRAMERIPYLVCHGDAQRRNLFTGREASGEERTVAIDWANFATAPVATDIATLVHYALVYFDALLENVADLDRHVLDSYLKGLHTAGWEGDADAVRFAYCALLAYGIGLLEIDPVMRLALDESRHAGAESFYGRPIGEILDRRAAVARFLIERGREAQSLVGHLGRSSADGDFGQAGD